MRIVATLTGAILVPTSLTKAALSKLTKADLVELLSGVSIPAAAAELGITRQQ